MTQDTVESKWLLWVHCENDAYKITNPINNQEGFINNEGFTRFVFPEPR